MNNKMGIPKSALPKTDEELIHMLGLDDAYADNNQDMDIAFRTSNNGFEDSQIYQQSVDNSMGFHQPYQGIYYDDIFPTGINHPQLVLDEPWNSPNNFNQESAFPVHNAANQDGYFGSNINMLVEDLITELDRSDEVLQDSYSGSNDNKLVDDIIIDHDLNSFIQSFNDVPAPTTRFESVQDNQQLMDNFLMGYQPTEIISYVDMSEPGFENGLY